MIGARSVVRSGRRVRSWRETSSTIAPMTANASSGEANVGAPCSGAARALSRYSASANAPRIASRRSTARGPAPMISTSSVCADSG
jgi:hypothetical protein